MLMKIEVDIINQCNDGDTLGFRLRDIRTGQIYSLLSCHRTDNPWMEQSNQICYCGNLHRESDVLIAFLHCIKGGRNILYIKREI